MKKIFDKFFTGINYWGSKNATKMWREWDAESVENDMRLLSESGVTMLRIFPTWDDFQPLTAFRRPHTVVYGMKGEVLPDTPAGKYAIDEVMCERFEEFCKIADKYGIRLVVGLLTGHMSGNDFIPPALANLNVVSDPAAIRWEIRYLTYMVKRLKHIENIVAWDLGNEVEALRDNNTKDEFHVWCMMLANTIRAYDGTRPILSGIGRFEVDRCDPSLYDLAEACDMNTVHLYNIFHTAGDPVNSMLPVLDNIFKCQLSEDLTGMPTFPQEFGATGYLNCSKQTEREFYRACVLSTMSHGYKGTMYWCAFDQGHLTFPPYEWNNIGSDYGFFDKDLKIKPVGEENLRLKPLVEMVGNNLPARKPNCVIIHPRDEENLQTPIVRTSYLMAKRANLEPRLAYALDKLPDSELYIIPSIRGSRAITNSGLNELLKKVKEGATLYISLSYALFRNIPEIAGVTVNNRSNFTNSIKLTVGDTVLPMTNVFEYDISEGESEVLGRDEKGMPMFVKNKYGKGNIYVLFSPMEENIAQRHGSFVDEDVPDYELIYRILGESIKEKRQFATDSKFILHTEHHNSDGSVTLFAINYSGRKNTARLISSGEYDYDVIWGDKFDNGVIELEPCDGLVIRATKKV